MKTIEQVLYNLQCGKISEAQAESIINQHIEAARLAVEDECLRDEFAGKAMQAAATNAVGASGFTFEQRAEWAYQQADAMLEARKK